MARSKQSDLSLMELYKQVKKQHGDAILCHPLPRWRFL